MLDLLRAAERACKAFRGTLAYIGAAVDTAVKAEVQHPYYTPDLLGPITSAAGAGAGEGPEAVSARPTDAAPASGHPASVVPPTAVDGPVPAGFPGAGAGSPDITERLNAAADFFPQHRNK